MAQSTIATTIENGQLQIVTDSGTILVNPHNLSDTIREMLILHGLKQKICDAAAIPRDTETGRSASPEAKFSAMRAVADRLLAGEWGIVRGEGGVSGQSLLFRALSRMYAEKSPEEIRGYLAKLDKKQQAALRKNPRVATIIAEIQAASVKSDDVDTDELLAELSE